MMVNSISQVQIYFYNEMKYQLMIHDLCSSFVMHLEIWKMPNSVCKQVKISVNFECPKSERSKYESRLNRFNFCHAFKWQNALA